MMDKSQIQLYKFRAHVLKALSHHIRVAIVEFLEERERCVCEIVEHLGEKQSSVSRHLSTLRSAGIVETRKEGLQIYYSLKTPCVKTFFSCIDNILKEQHEERGKLLKSL